MIFLQVSKPSRCGDPGIIGIAGVQAVKNFPAVWNPIAVAISVQWICLEPHKHPPARIPLETRLLREAKAAGCEILGGLEMLLAQAVAQFETWTDLEAPLEVMKSVALLLAQAEEP